MLPNLVVIGAQKCGTSALHYYLSLHPEVSMSNPKELNFFIKPQWDRESVEWYESHFQEPTKVRGESSPNYTTQPKKKGAARRMHSLIPEAKLIYMVRDPLERIVSAYIHNVSEGRETKDLFEALTHQRSTYLVRSAYHRQVTRFMKFYPRSQLLVLEQDDLLERREETLRQLFRFLEVDEGFWDPAYQRLRHQTRNKLRLRHGIRKHLEQQLQPAAFSSLNLAVTENLWDLREDLDRFRDFAGRDFEHWSL
jgi:hypothetical protein